MSKWKRRHWVSEGDEVKGEYDALQTVREKWKWSENDKKILGGRRDVTKKGGKVGIKVTVTSIFWKARWMKMKMINVHTNSVERKFPHARILQDSYCICVRDISSATGISCWQCNCGQQQWFIADVNKLIYTCGRFILINLMSWQSIN